MRGRGILSAIVLIAACSNEPAGVRPPAIDAAAVAASPSNVLSAAVAVGVRSADSVRVRYGLEGSPLDSTTVSITHDMKVAFKIADRVAMLYNGRIVEEGSPHEFQASKNPIVQQFIEGRALGPLTE